MKKILSIFLITFIVSVVNGQNLGYDERLNRDLKRDLDNLKVSAYYTDDNVQVDRYSYIPQFLGTNILSFIELI